MPSSKPRLSGKDERAVRKEISKLEKKIARLDDQKRELNQQMMNTTDAEEAMKVHEELQTVTTELSEAEERWCELQEQIE